MRCGGLSGGRGEAGGGGAGHRVRGPGRRGRREHGGAGRPANGWRRARRTGFEVYRGLERWALLRPATTVRLTRRNADALRRFYRRPPRVRFDGIPPAVPFPDAAATPGTAPVARVLFV